MSAGNDKHLNIWKTDGELIDLIERNEQENLNCVLMISNKRLVTAGNGAEMVVYSLIEKRCVSLLLAHREPVRCLVSLNSTMFASASIDGQIVIWSSVTLTQIHDLNYHKTYINADHVYMYNVHQLVKLSEQYLAACIGCGFTVFKISEKAAECVMECLNAHSATVLSIAPLYYGTALVTSSADTTIRIWGSKVDFQFRPPPASKPNAPNPNQNEKTQGSNSKDSKHTSSSASSRSKSSKSETNSKQASSSSESSHRDASGTKDNAAMGTNAIPADPRIDAKYVPAEKTVERSSMSSLLTLLDSEKPSVGTYPPRLLGDVCCHSDQVNVILPLSPFSYASASSDGGIVIWRDGRVQSSFRTDWAISSLKQWHTKQFEMGILEATTTQYASAEAKYSLNGSESSLGERSMFSNNPTNAQTNNNFQNFQNFPTPGASNAVPSHLSTNGSTGSNSTTISMLGRTPYTRETNSFDLNRSPSTDIVPSGAFDSAIHTPGSTSPIPNPIQVLPMHPNAANQNSSSHAVRTPPAILTPTLSFESITHLNQNPSGSSLGGAGSQGSGGLASPRSPASSRPGSGKLPFNMQNMNANQYQQHNLAQQQAMRYSPYANKVAHQVKVPPFIADNAYYLYYELGYTLEQVQESLLADGNNESIVIAAIAELQQ